MYEKLELERIKLEVERMEFEKERNEKEYRFRCIEIARNSSCDNATLLQDAKKILDFIEAK
ncbi:MAG: hypothetical protein EOM44_00500 [Bacteroidia bacterium]|nr:hypothetical protein [Bacteroidia bacterium]